jgi:ADP-heptose:LPS heptosyltransferase
MHLAALVGTPMVALFSARQFSKMWEPHSHRVVILRTSIPPLDLHAKHQR